jgi:hypothetical protein
MPATTERTQTNGTQPTHTPPSPAAQATPIE